MTQGCIRNSHWWKSSTCKSDQFGPFFQLSSCPTYQSTLWRHMTITSDPYQFPIWPKYQNQFLHQFLSGGSCGAISWMDYNPHHMAHLLVPIPHSKDLHQFGKQRKTTIQVVTLSWFNLSKTNHQIIRALTMLLVIQKMAGSILFDVLIWRHPINNKKAIWAKKNSNKTHYLKPIIVWYLHTKSSVRCELTFTYWAKNISFPCKTTTSISSFPTDGTHDIRWPSTSISCISTKKSSSNTKSTKLESHKIRTYHRFIVFTMGNIVEITRFPRIAHDTPIDHCTFGHLEYTTMSLIRTNKITIWWFYQTLSHTARP